MSHQLTHVIRGNTYEHQDYIKRVAARHGMIPVFDKSWRGWIVDEATAVWVTTPANGRRAARELKVEKLAAAMAFASIVEAAYASGKKD